MSALVESNPEYEKVRLINVDWDEIRGAPLLKELRVPRQSTLVMFKGGEEVARVVAQTSEQAIEELFKAVL